MWLVSKEIRINVRTTEEIKRDLEITARLRGITVSALVNSQVVKAIREEKEREPRAFQNRSDIQNLDNEIAFSLASKTVPTIELPVKREDKINKKEDELREAS